MKVTLLGTGTSNGVPVIGCSCEACISGDTHDKRLRTSAFVEEQGHHLLIDPGPDLRQQLLTNHITRVDAILVTHEHKDHVGGLDDIRPINFMMKPDAMEIYGLGRVLNVIKKDYDYAFSADPYPGVPSFALKKVNEEPFVAASIEIIPIKIKHLSLPILGFRIGDFAYITDASFIASKELQKLMGLKLLVINALRIREHYSHFNLSQALSIIEKLVPQQTFLTHIGHDMGKYAEINPQLPPNVELGYDGLTVEI